MSKILLAALTTAVLATSGFANQVDWDGTVNISAGGTVEASNDHTLTGTMNLEKSIISQEAGEDSLQQPAIEAKAAAKFQIDEGKTVIVKGTSIKASTEQLSGAETENNKRVNPQIILNGTLVLKKAEETVPTLKEVQINSMNMGNDYGVLDISSIRALPEDADSGEIDKEAIKSNLESTDIDDNLKFSKDTDLSPNIANIRIVEPGTIPSSQNKYNGVEVKLPFNCNFGKTSDVVNLDLSGANSVTYTYLSKKDVVATQKEHIVENNENSPAGKLIQKDPNGTTYGDYRKGDLGVSLPTNNVTAIECSLSGQMTFESVMNGKDADNDNTGYNSQGYYLKTNDLDNDGTKHEVPYDNTKEVQNYDTTYNFGFCGSTPITISLAADAGENAIESAKAIFKGDNSCYTPLVKDNDDTTSIDLPSEVEFAANSSLFPFTQTYGKGTFAEGNYTNTLPAGQTATFNNGFTLGAGHTLNVSGTLIG